MASLLQRFAGAVERHGDRPALILHDRTWTYEQLGAQAGRIAGAIAEGGMSQHRLVGLLARESLTAYAGVPAILAAGRGFVPLDPTDPPARIREVVAKTGIDTLVVGVEALDRLEGVLEAAGRPLAVVAPEAGRLRGTASRHPRHRYQTARDLPAACRPLSAAPSPESTACLMYTSGSTGVGREVAVSHENIEAYLDVVDRRLPVDPGDRCGHHVALTSDFAVHDLFTTWANGACLAVWPTGRRSDPAQFINDHRLTRWSTVPAVAAAMQRRGELEAGRFPTLRDTLFFGGPLSASVARDWARAAPDSSVVNLYGPTEATVAVSMHRFRPDADAEHCRRGLVPLGEPLEGHATRIVGDDTPADGSTRGELWVAGPQVAPGYRRAPEATHRRFVRAGRADREGPWFRTGDLVERDADGRLHLCARLDDRVRLKGRRVELSEVERTLRWASDRSGVRAVGWPRDDAAVYGLVGLVATDEPLDVQAVLARCRRHLPRPMVPDRLVEVAEIPTDVRDRLDTAELHHILERQEVST